MLKADTKRIALLEEEKRLTKLVNEGNIETEVSDKLKEVCGRREGGVGMSLIDRVWNLLVILENLCSTLIATN